MGPPIPGYRTYVHQNVNIYHDTYIYVRCETKQTASQHIRIRAGPDSSDDTEAPLHTTGLLRVRQVLSQLDEAETVAKVTHSQCK